jgi:hypothetical protein
MRRGILLSILVAIVIAIVGTMLTRKEHSNIEQTVQSCAFNGIIAEYQGTEPCEVIVDLGYVKRSAMTEEIIRLTNRSNSPIVLLDYSTQCRCMWLEFKREVIDVNESIDITLTFDSRGEWGTVGNYMEIATSVNSFPIVLWIGAEIE